MKCTRMVSPGFAFNVGAGYIPSNTRVTFGWPLTIVSVNDACSVVSSTPSTLSRTSGWRSSCPSTPRSPVAL